MVHILWWLQGILLVLNVRYNLRYMLTEIRNLGVHISEADNNYMNILTFTALDNLMRVYRDLDRVKPGLYC